MLTKVTQEMIQGGGGGGGSSSVLTPEMFGTIGVSPEGDTAAWEAMIAAANVLGGQIEVDLRSPVYLIQGTSAAIDNQTFSNFSSLKIRGLGTTELRQQNPLSKTIKYTGGEDVLIEGLTFIGYAQIRIDGGLSPLSANGGSGGEIDFNSSSGNAVAAVYGDETTKTTIRNCRTINHAGRDFVLAGCLHLIVENCDLTGLGPTYNRPLIDGHQGNGEDAAVYFIPKIDNIPLLYYEPSTTTAGRSTVTILNSRIKWHSFCLRTILNASITLIGNYFGETPGQHHIYDTDSDGHHVVGNLFEGCRQAGYKMQYENLYGRNYGEPWANSTSYAVGDVVRAVSIPWICVTAHTSPSSGPFTSTNWVTHPRYLRRGGVWQGNTFKNCGEGIGIIESSLVHGRNIWSEGYVVSGNTFRDCSEAMYMDRCWEATVVNNNVHSCNYGFFGRSFSGEMSGNSFYDTGKNCILAFGIGKASKISENVFTNYGLTGTDVGNSAAVLIVPHEGTSILVKSNSPRVLFKNNSFFHYIKGQAADTREHPSSYLVYCSDPSVIWEIEGSSGTPTVRQFRIDGTVVQQFRNHFNGYANAAQNEPQPGTIEGLLTTLKAKRVHN